MEMLERFAETLRAAESETLRHVRDYIEWQAGRALHFTPSEEDDVELRTYLLLLKTSGVNRTGQSEQMAALRRFYAWANAEGLTHGNPFDEFSVERPVLTREQIRRRRDTRLGTAEEREIARLRALNQLAEQLNRSHDIQTALTMALETLVTVMSLQTAWAFLLPAAGSHLHSAAAQPLHDFAVAARKMDCNTTTLPKYTSANRPVSAE